MDRSSDFHDSDILRLMTAALDSVVGACTHAQTDIDKLRFTAARHILASVGAGERDGKRLAFTALEHVRSQDLGDEVASDIPQWPCAHRNSA
jgi:hypothetical protein